MVSVLCWIITGLMYIVAFILLMVLDRLFFAIVVFVDRKFIKRNSKTLYEQLRDRMQQYKQYHLNKMIKDIEAEIFKDQKSDIKTKLNNYIK
jgi:CDP-glycerol glycerophosphotransferase (TagB/SpsB family)